MLAGTVPEPADPPLPVAAGVEASGEEAVDDAGVVVEPWVSLSGADGVPAAAGHVAGVGVKLGVGPKNATRNAEMLAGSPRVT